MAYYFLLGIALVASFYFLSKSADLIILNMREIGEKLGIRMFFLGIILGFFTSFPELFLGINAVINDIQEISAGNLLGGIMVLFGLVLGISLILNREIKNNGEITEYIIISAYVFFPLLMGLDGKLGFIDGIIIISVYMLLLYVFYVRQKSKNFFEIDIINKNEILKKCLTVVLGLILLLIISNLIIKISILLLGGLQVSTFLVGLILFSLGTNLPELIVSIRSYQRKVEGLSISNLAGSAMANVMIIGVFSFIKPIYLEVNFSYYLLIFFTAAIFAFFLFFYKTDKLLSRNEGFVLVAIYFLFLAAQIKFLIASASL